MKTPAFSPRLPQPVIPHSPENESHTKNQKRILLSPRRMTHRKTDSADFQLFKRETQGTKTNVFNLQQTPKHNQDLKLTPNKKKNENESKNLGKNNMCLQQNIEQWKNERKRMVTENVLSKQKAKFEMPKWFAEKKQKQFKLKKSGSQNFLNFHNEHLNIGNKQVSKSKHKSKRHREGKNIQNQLSNQRRGIMSSNLYNSMKQEKGLMDLQMKVIKLEEMNQNLQYQLQNVYEDKNLLISHNQALQCELKYYKMKIKQNQKREEEFKVLEQGLKIKIKQLEEQINRNQDKKSILLETGISQSSIKTLNLDKDIVLRKNEEISRLNQIINKTRERVCDLNKSLSQEKSKNLIKIHELTQYFQFELSQKEENIQKLSKQISNFKTLESTLRVPISPRSQTERNFDLVIPKRDKNV